MTNQRDSFDEPTSEFDIEQLADALDTLFAAQRELMCFLADRIGILEVDLRALMYIRQRGRVGPKALARHLRLMAGGATTVVDRLSRRDLVARLPNPGDRRSLFVTPTKKGASIASSIRQNFAAELELAITNPLDRRLVGVMVQRINRRISSSEEPPETVEPPRVEAALPDHVRWSRATPRPPQLG